MEITGVSMGLKLRKSDTSSQSTNKLEIGEINEVLVQEEGEDKRSIDNNSNNKDSDKSNDDEKYIDQHIKYLNIFILFKFFHDFITIIYWNDRYTIYYIFNINNL